MKKIASLSLVFTLIFSCCFMFFGCGMETINVNVVEDANAKAETVINTFYDKKSGTALAAVTKENFYVEVSSEVDSNLEVVKINDISHTANEDVSYSVGNNNFVETPSWLKEDGRLYIAVPTLFVEAVSGVVKIHAGNKIFNVTVFENAGQLKMDSVTLVGTTKGGTAEKTTTENGKLPKERDQ